MYNHTDIDNHLNDTTKAHFGQDLRITGNPCFMNLSVSENISSKTNETDTQLIKKEITNW